LMTTIVGALLDAAAYGFAAQSVIAPLNGLEITLNILLAPCVLHEKVTLAHVAGTLLVAGGASLTSVFGPHDSATPSFEELQELLFRWNVLIYVVGFASGLVLCAVVVKVRPKEAGDKARGIALGVAAGSLAGNMWFVKCAVGLLKLGFSGDWSPWSHWLPYALVVSAVLVAVGNVPLMVMGLQEYEAVFMVTLFGGSSIVMACVSGDVVLLEMQGQSTFNRVAFWMSVLSMILGLLVINTTSVQGADKNGDEVQELSPRELDEQETRQRAGTFRELNEVSSLTPRGPVLWARPFVGVAVAATQRPRHTRCMSDPDQLAGERRLIEKGDARPRFMTAPELEPFSSSKSSP